MNNTCDTLICDASLVVPNKGILPDVNILIENGKIKGVQSSVNNVCADKKISVNGKYVLPGVIDPHIHYGVYTPIERAAVTESKSAAIGGVTTIIRMMRLADSYKNIDQHLKASRGAHYIDYAIHASLFNFRQLGDIEYLKKKGINSFKLYLNLGFDLNSISMDQEPGSNCINNEEVNVTPELVVATLKRASEASSIVLVHAEDPLVCSRRIADAKAEEKAHKSIVNPLETWSNCRPPISEAETISLLCRYARNSDCRIYFVHLGSRLAIETATREKTIYPGRMYIETCPHYLTHSTDYSNVLGKVVPPLRTREDVAFTWWALANGLIDTIGSDHVANTLSLKRGNGDLWSTLSGFPGVATLLPVLLSKGVNEGKVDLVKVSQITSYNTARIFGLYPRKGIIQPGSDADIVVIDLSLKQKVSPEILQSHSDYTIYDGWELRGWPIMTMVRGRVIMEHGKINESSLGHGQYVFSS
ncbi:MAG: amidohydrolase family protein [Nitrososphaeraceae archaeon]